MRPIENMGFKDIRDCAGNNDIIVILLSYIIKYTWCFVLSL